MLLLVFVLVFISAVILPNVEFAGNTVQEIERMGQARIAAEKVANLANRLQDQSIGAKQTVTVFVPKDSNILCFEGVDGNIGFSVVLQGGPATACELDGDGSSQICTKLFAIRSKNLVCDPSPDSFHSFVQGKQSTVISIEKTFSGTTVKVQ